VLSLLALASLCSLAAADCNRVRSVYASYSKTYVAPVQYIVPQVIAVEVQRQHYYSIDGAYQQSLLADAIVGRLLQLQMGATKGTERREPGPGNGSPGGSYLGGAVAGQLGASNYQSPELAAALKNACLKCHDGKVRTAFLSSDDRLLDLPKSKVCEIYRLVNTGKMPKGASPLEDKYMPLIDAWVEGSK